MNKKAIFTFAGMNQDISKSKQDNRFYFEGNNIRITSTDSQTTGAITNEKGNELVISIPTPVFEPTLNSIKYGTKSLTYDPRRTEIVKTYTGKTSGEQIIIGNINSRNDVIVFSTDNNGFDCIWKFDDNHELTLLYMRNLGFSTSNLIQAVFNYENERIQKIYWADGKNQLRFLNTEHSIDNKYVENLIDVNSNTINIVGNFITSQPDITDVVSGGTHTAGMIQYTYNLYRLNSSQTKLAPLTELIPLDKGTNQGGGALNEIVGSTPVVDIKVLDPEYTHIKVYAVKYTSYNQIPTISLIKDQEISSNRLVTIFDDGNVINDISLAEFLFLGSDPITPEHIETKDNYLLLANVKESVFDIELDTRAYSFDSLGVSKVYDGLKLKTGTQTIIGDGYTVDPTWNVLPKIDAVNKDYDTYKFQKDGATRGGEGKFLKYEIVQDTTLIEPDSKKVFKDNEIYRLGIHFYNGLGQISLPKWVADFKAPEGNLERKYNTLKVTLKPEFYVWLNTSSNFETENDKPVGYRILRADRTQNDKTIISQGFLNAFMSNYRADDKSHEFGTIARNRCAKGNKLPSLQRPFAKHHTQMEPMKHNLKLDTLSVNEDADDMREVHKAKSTENMVAETFQYNILMQMFSPDVMFGNVALYEGLQLRVKGALKNKVTQFWGQIRSTETKDVLLEGKVLNGLTPHEDILFGDTQEIEIDGSVNAMADFGLFGPPSKGENEEMDFYQLHRNFTGDYVKAVGKNYPIYGKPQLTTKGQGSTIYNGDPNFTYYNTLQPMLVDGGDGSGENGPALTSVNSWGAKNITMVLGPNQKDYDPTTRPKLETLWSESGVTDTNVMLVAELVKNNIQIYLGSIYGGNSFEDKKRTNYLEIGDYKTIDNVTTYIDSPGDTFVHNFKFAKLSKTDTEVYTPSSMQITEIVEGRVETDIDLRNRNDISLAGWDARFQPRYDEFHEYNRVYSQAPTLVKNQDVDYTFVKVKTFDARIVASKLKVPGENIDSWTDILPNESIDLNGKNGPITSLISFKDNIFAFQDSALAAIGINPRVQVQGGDGIAIELGSGGVLHDYKYVTTTSGSVNKWGAIATDKAIYYIDVLNNSFCRYAGQVEKFSDNLGLHSWFQNNLEQDLLRIDNPVLGTGVSLGYDLINNDIMLSLHQTNKKTLLFNEMTNSFVSFMSYCPSRYIYHTNRLYSLDSTNYNIYEHFKGDYNYFYGQYYPSYVVLQLNPDINFHSVFNTIEFNSELYLDGIDQFDKTLTHIQAYNEYQDSGKVPLLFGRGSNLQRKFRTWRADVPRVGRERIRNPWIFLKLELDNTDNYKLVLHDIIVNYSVS